MKMAEAVITSNLNTNINSISGGVLKVTLSGGVAQANDGISLPCRTCKVKEDEGNNALVRVNFCSPADEDSFPLGSFNGDTHQAEAIDFDIDDVSKLYFYSSQNDAIVYIFYRV